MTIGTTDKLPTQLSDQQPDVDSKKDWKLAAAVFDRFLFIVFSILLVAGTVVFFTCFVVNYHPNDD